MLHQLCYRYRNHLAGLPLLFALFSSYGEWTSEPGTWTVALLLAAAGIGMRVWGIRHCLYSYRKVPRLATTGPYAYVRNPLYLGNTLVIAGATAASELMWLVPFSVLWCLTVFTLTIRDEERRLLDDYGDEYRAYREAVPAWLPRWTPYGGEVPARVPTLPIVLRQSTQLPYLVPFVAKELL
ncbi:MAG: isoprenylcysteine carboxylmethyltransferase family protein [Planctomycetes bacterium]|nr:isoprenylcysteine carboxylmethyltransferase family protein [Planctomycetota bacterium]